VAVDAAAVPEVLKALSHPVRWRLVTHLSRGDHRVGELVHFVDQPQNLVSYHLKLLRDAALVREHRSSRDARDIYYSLDLDRVRTALDSSTRSLHAGLRVVAGSAPSERPGKRVRVLFLCTENSARSQLAEAILRDVGKGEVEAFSAGSRPSGVHPMAIAVLTELGFDHSSLRSKPIKEFEGQRFDYIITLCDIVREECPSFPGDPERIHWSFPDPVATPGDEADLRAVFTRTATELTTRIRFLLLTTRRESL
jgi:protein-tyrosine-phosphatase/DNA-binding transcriptional ArsR family regulator